MCSMISGQCDKLRETADRLDSIADVRTPWVHCKLTPMLRDAADLILELRDDLQQANDENARLRSCLSDDAENVQLIMGENTRLRELCKELAEFLTEAEWLQWPELRAELRELRIEVNA